VRIEDCANVATSFPGFVELAKGCGFELDEVAA
jgi:3-phosphoshikimate 1-carboxyvinyltransferase